MGDPYIKKGASNGDHRPVSLWIHCHLENWYKELCASVLNRGQIVFSCC